MAIRPIVRYPDPRLRRVCEPVEVFDQALIELTADLLDTMLAAPGVGITAAHIGVARRVTVLQLPGDASAITYVNPVIVRESNERTRYAEGSVSMPDVTEEIERAAHVQVSYQDIDGAFRMEEASGFRAVCHQHEIDQLDGVFWLQRLSQLKRERAIKRFQKLLRLR